jgi:hypothetical protein
MMERRKECVSGERRSESDEVAFTVFCCCCRAVVLHSFTRLESYSPSLERYSLVYRDR